MNKWLVILLLVPFATGCGQDIYSSNVEHHYAENGSPRNVRHAIITGHFVNSEHGAALCDNPRCRYMLPVDTEQMSAECINEINGRDVAVIGSISSGRLTRLDSVHFPDNSVPCVF